ncbi:MAG: hypothetical protein ABSH44_11335 [Bryobacteraceae bacterium]|jgi:hypothetical protein
MAHTYSTDSNERKYIPFLIAGAAIGAAFVAFHIIDGYQIKAPWWASPPIDTMAFYGIFYGLFEKYVWKWSLLGWLHIVRIPNLSGTWRGEVRPAETGGVSSGLATPTEITVKIQQTWTTMLITGRTTLSQSHSLSGNLLVADERSMSYEYMNEPSAAAPGTMHSHRGVARLSLNKEDTVLEGEYYSGRDRQNIGAIHLTRS